jgi:hypothetical protein
VPDEYIGTWALGSDEQLTELLSHLPIGMRFPGGPTRSHSSAIVDARLRQRGDVLLDRFPNRAIVPKTRVEHDHGRPSTDAVDAERQPAADVY